VLGDLVEVLTLGTKSRSALVAENLFLWKQLALFQAVPDRTKRRIWVAFQIKILRRARIPSHLVNLWPSSVH